MRGSTLRQGGIRTMRECPECEQEFRWLYWDDPLTELCEPCHRVLRLRMQFKAADYPETQRDYIKMKLWKGYPDSYFNGELDIGRSV